MRGSTSTSGKPGIPQRAAQVLPRLRGSHRVGTLDLRGELLLDELPRGRRRVRVAEPGLATGARLDNHDRRRVPFESAVRLGLVGRDLVRRDVEPLYARLGPGGGLHFRPGRDSLNSTSLPSSDFCITPLRSGSPLTIAFAIFSACIRVMCGGSGGTSGSTLTSSTHSLPAESAC